MQHSWDIIGPALPPPGHRYLSCGRPQGSPGATNRLFSSSFPSLSCLLYPKGISLQSQCNVASLILHQTKASCFLFHLVLVHVRCSFFLRFDPPLHRTLATNLSSCFSHLQLELEPGIATELGQEPCLVFSFLLRREIATFVLEIGYCPVELCQASSLNSLAVSSSSHARLALSFG